MTKARATANLARFVNTNGEIDPDDGLQFDLPLTATNDGIVTATTVAGLPTSGNDNGRIGVVQEGSTEGSIRFWNGTSWDDATTSEWGGSQSPPTPSLVALTSPNYGGSQYFNTSVSIRASATKSIGEDPVVAYQFTSSGQAVTIANPNKTNITPTNSPSVSTSVAYPSISSNASTTLRCTFYDAQDNAVGSNFLGISWRANTAPTLNSFTTNKGSTTANAPEPGETVTLTISASDTEGGTLEYYVQKTSGASISTSPSLNSWTTDNTFTFTVPEVDDGSNDYNQLVFSVKARDSGGLESGTVSETVNYKRPARTGDRMEIISLNTYSRSSSTDKYGIQSISYPSGIQAGDVLVLWVGAHGVPYGSGNTTWDGTYNISGEYPFNMDGDQLDNGGSYLLQNPNYYGGAPSIVSSGGWERAHNPYIGSHSPTSSKYSAKCISTAKSYERRYQTPYGSNTRWWNGSAYTDGISTTDCFFKVCTGSESGSFNVFGTHSSTDGYGHAHMGETAALAHLRMKTSAGVSVAVSDFGILFAQSGAFNEDNATGGIQDIELRIDDMNSYASGSSNDGTNGLNRTINYVEVDNNPIFYWHFLLNTGNSSDTVVVDDDGSLYDVSFASGYYNGGSLYSLGDAGGGIGNFYTTLQASGLSDQNTQQDAPISTRGWYGSTQATTALVQQSGRNSLPGNSHIAMGSLRGVDATRINDRDLDLRYDRGSSSYQDNTAIGHAGCIQFKANDPLYP